MDLISREALIDSLYSCEELKGRRVIEAVANTIKEQPTVEAVPKSYADQIRWERDIVVGQLNEIGCQFGQKMDEVKKKLEATSFVKCKDCKYFCDGYPNLLNADGLCENVDCLVDLDDFCSFGERKENEINRCR